MKIGEFKQQLAERKQARLQAKARNRLVKDERKRRRARVYDRGNDNLNIHDCLVAKHYRERGYTWREVSTMLDSSVSKIRHSMSKEL